MSHQHRAGRTSDPRVADLFEGMSAAQASCPANLPPGHLSAYVEALEARCNALWGYIQGYECSSDPVVRFLAAELGITVSHAGNTESIPAAD